MIEKILVHGNSWFFNQRKENFNFIFFFRIMVGFFLLLDFVLIIPDYKELFGIHSLIPSEVCNLYNSPTTITTFKVINFINVKEEYYIIFFFFIYITLCIALISGFYTRIISFTLIILHTSFYYNNPNFMYGYDYFISMSLIHLLIFPSQSSINYLFYRRILQIHLIIAYFFSGFDKLLGYNWRNGEAIWKAITLPSSNNDFRINFDSLLNFSIIFPILSWSVIILELFYILIMIKKVTNYWLFFIVSMHLGIAIALNLYLFSAIMIVWNLAAFYNFNPTKQLSK